MGIYNPPSSTFQSISARYTTTAGQSIPSVTGTIVNFDTKDYDTNSAVTTGASWKFTAPVSGKYSVKSFIEWTNASFTVGNGVSLDLYKNGSYFSRIDFRQIPSTASWAPASSGAETINLTASDYIDLRVTQGESTARTLITGAGDVRIAIEWVGN